MKLLKWQFLKIEVTMLIFYLIFFQLWDIRDGMCKQTFPGHESDINAVTVKQLVTLFLAEISNAEVVNSVLFIISPIMVFVVNTSLLDLKELFTCKKLVEFEN